MGPRKFGAAAAAEMWNCRCRAERPRHAGLIQTAFDVRLCVKWAGGPEFTQTHTSTYIHGPVRAHTHMLITQGTTCVDARIEARRKSLSWYYVLYSIKHTSGKSSTWLCQGVLNPLYSSGFNSRASQTFTHMPSTSTWQWRLSCLWAKTDCWLTHNTYVKQILQLHRDNSWDGIFNSSHI